MGSNNWMGINIVVPGFDGQEILKLLADKFDLKQIDEDWCALKRERDNAAVDYFPTPVPPGRKARW